jgi:signal transduction histidine kinase
MLLLVFIYYSIVGETEQQLKRDINVQLADLGREFIYRGPNATAEEIKRLISKDDDKMLVLMLIDRKWHTLAGNLEEWPGGKLRPADWIRIRVNDADTDSSHDAIAINSSLPGGYVLLVGRSLTPILRIRHIISNVLYICLFITAVLAAAGGVLLTLVIQRRLEIINQACRRVMGGELTTRVPVSGSGDEFDHLANNLNAMLARICELIDGVRDISYNVAHDLRTPLGRMRNRLEATTHLPMSREQMQEAIALAIVEIDNLVATFNAILRIAQAEMGAGIEHFDLVDLSDTVAEVTEFYQPLAEDKHIQLQTDLQTDVELRGDRHLLAQACANLLDNAIKYTPYGGHVQVRLERNGGKVRLIVSDSGPGIPESHYGKVTDKFYRLEASRTQPGNGLGLSLVLAAVKLHGGQLRFEDNRPGLRVVVEV